MPVKKVVLTDCIEHAVIPEIRNLLGRSLCLVSGTNFLPSGVCMNGTGELIIPPRLGTLFWRGR